MLDVKYVSPADRAFWFRLDRHLPEAEFDRKVRDRMGYVLWDGPEPIGLLRYNLFWDNTPFCTMLYISEDRQGQGCGRTLMEHWENEMRALGYGMVMTSTQVDENAQHFYRRLGYRDAGGLVMDLPGFAQPMELFLVKAL